MSGAAWIFLLSLAIVLLTGVILYQQYAFRTEMQKTLNEMSEKLAEILDKDSEENVMVFTDHTAVMALAAQINRMLESRRRLRVDFRRSEAASRKMLSNISHDIKTPMTVILGYLEMMRLDNIGEMDMLLKVEQKARDVMALIDQFFTLAKLEAGDDAMEISPVDICEICRANVLDFYEILTGKDFQVDIAIPGEPVFVRGNPEALQRILSNLISNVIRYGADGGYLGVFLRQDEKNAYIDVVDKGKGIDPVFAAKVFDRLFTLEDSRNRRIQGNGLGLTIARNLARRLGGEIFLESEPFVKTVFTVRLCRERNS